MYRTLDHRRGDTVISGTLTSGVCGLGLFGGVLWASMPGGGPVPAVLTLLAQHDQQRRTLAADRRAHDEE